MTGFTSRTARFADGTATEIDAVVWATGFRSDYLVDEDAVRFDTWSGVSWRGRRGPIGGLFGT